MKPLPLFAVVVAGAATFSLSIADASAAVIWKAGNDDAANVVTSWWTTETGTANPSAIGTSDTLWFGGSGQGASRTIGLGGNLTVGAIRLDNQSGTPNYNATIASGNTLTLNGNNDYTSGIVQGIVLNSAAGGVLTINADVALGATQQWVSSRTLAVGGNVALNGNNLNFWTAGPGGTITISGNISGAGGNLLLSNSNNAANVVNLNGTLSGSFGLQHTASNGTLSIGGTTTSGYSGNINLGTAHGGAFNVAAGATLVTSGTFTMPWRKTVTVDGTLTTAGATIATTGTVAINGAGTFNVASMLVANNTTVGFGASGTFNNSGSFFLGNASSQAGNWNQTAGTVNLTSATADAIRIGHWPSQTSTYTLSNGTLNATGVDTVVGWDGNGVLTISGGTANLRGIRMGNTAANGIHNGAGTVNLNSGGTLNIGAGGISSGGAGAKSVNLNGGTLGALAAWASGQAMNVSATSTVDTTGGDITLSGVLSGAGGLTKDGIGTLTLSNNGNSFGGPWTIDGGVVVASGAMNAAASTTSTLGAKSSGRTITINNGGTLRFAINNVFAGGGEVVGDVPTIIVNAGGTADSTRFNVIGNVHLNGGVLTQSSSDSGNYQGYQFLDGAQITVGGATMSTISSGNGKGNHLPGGGSVIFDVADVTAGTDLLVSNSLLDGSGDYLGAGSFVKVGQGAMVLSGANTYSGTTAVNNGTLQLNGTHTGGAAYTVAASAMLSGMGTSDALVGGAGTISPGNNAGILTFGQLDPSGGLDFHFSFAQTGDPTWSNAAASGNDVFRLTDATPITAAMTGANEFNLFLDTATLTGGDAYRGGIFTDASGDFVNLIADATVNFFILGDGLGSDTMLDGVSYYSLDNFNTADIANADFLLDISTAQVPSANFASGTVAGGWTMQINVTATPEPGSVALWILLGGSLMGGAIYRRRK